MDDIPNLKGFDVLPVDLLPRNIGWLYAGHALTGCCPALYLWT
jgi:hypothetical protein